MSVDADTVRCSSSPKHLLKWQERRGKRRRVEAAAVSKSTSLTIFHRQLDTVFHHNGWKAQGNAIHLHVILQGQSAGILHSVPSGVTYQVIVWTLKVCYGDIRLAAAYGSQFKSRTQLSGKSVQEFASAV
jgi:hypothetical protein